MQLLEGEREVVEELYEEIKRDPRHHSVHTCYEGPIEKRGFASSTMAFQNTSTLDSVAVEGFSNFLTQGFTSELVSEDPSNARDFLQMLSTLVI